ncbi:MFS transporter [Caldovatus sediminis]|uniref:MFS transporter n=1 Tax=Caldovatus sediminis TaxID=2041189 RepID=A0A8J3EDM6_9PROT|nr:MFS transporter [Caldovatus sediminis]GGG44205.1 MFS transporter [Caldovatus sediminis]
MLLYALTYAAYGIEGPFLPALLAERGMSAEAIGLLLAAGTAARLLSAPLTGSLADRLGAPRLVLAGAILASALIGCGFVLADGFVALLFVSVAVSVALAPINPLSDSLASAAAVGGSGGQEPRRRFDYGVVRGVGSAAFVCGAIAAGPVVAGAGLAAVIWVNAGLLLLAALAVAALPRPGRGDAAPRPARGSAAPAKAERGSLREVLAMPLFLRLLVVTGLIQGSHALYGAFATIRWQEAGIAPEAIGMLWSVAVASEVVVFLGIGPPLLARFGPVGLAALAAAAGVVRWTVMANTALLPVQFGVQALHGLTFAALHLATMRMLAETIPSRLRATAFGVHASLGPGLAAALLTLSSGPLYGNLGAGGFWVMAALCALALPASFTLAMRGAGVPDAGDGAPKGLASDRRARTAA